MISDLRSIALFVALLLVPLPVPAAGTTNDFHIRPLQELVGEDLSYRMDFLIFEKLAAGRLRLSETAEAGVFRVELVGRTLGIANWLAGDRVQTYTSLMRRMPDGTLRSIEHVSRINKRAFGKVTDRGRRHRYDYEKREVVKEKSKNGVYRPGESFPFPAGDRIPVDMLTAFYNLRTGVYGSLVRGAEITIATFAHDGFGDIRVTVLSVEEQAKQTYFPPGGTLLRVQVDPEIFDNDSGLIYAWLSNAGQPERGIIEDMIGLGDVKGYRFQEETP